MENFLLPIFIGVTLVIFLFKFISGYFKEVFGAAVKFAFLALCVVFAGSKMSFFSGIATTSVVTGLGFFALGFWLNADGLKSWFIEGLIWGAIGFSIMYFFEIDNGLFIALSAGFGAVKELIAETKYERRGISYKVSGFFSKLGFKRFDSNDIRRWWEDLRDKA